MSAEDLHAVNRPEHKHDVILIAHTNIKINSHLCIGGKMARTSAMANMTSFCSKDGTLEPMK